MISPWYFFSCFPNCIVCLYPILSILKRFYTRMMNICEILHWSNTNFNSKEISVLVGNLQETKLQIWRNLLAQKPRETERTHLRHVTILHVWYFLDNITSDKKKGGKKMIVLDGSRLHKKFRKKKRKLTRRQRGKSVSMWWSRFLSSFFFHHDSFRNIDGLFRDMGKSIKI